ncbi:MAG: universal stress protein [Desulfobacterales bacterium]
MKPTSLKNILVAIDFSEATPEVIATAIMLSDTHSGKFWVVYANDSAPFLLSAENGDSPGPVNLDTRNTEVDDGLEKIKAQLSLAHVAAEFVLLDGPAADNILEKAREIEADLIVIGSQRHGRFYRMLFGDTGDELTRNAPCPVLVVPQKTE